MKKKKESHEALELAGDEAEKYRRSVGIPLDIAHDRPDCQFTIGECSKYIQKPTTWALRKFKRLIRYLHGTSNLGKFGSV